MKTKKALKHDEVVMTPKPNHPELSVANLYELFKEDAVVMAHLPDMGKKKCPKDYLWRVLATLRPEWTQKVIDEAERQREEDRIKGPEKDNKVEWDPEFLLALAQVQQEKEGKFLNIFIQTGFIHVAKTGKVRKTVHIDVSKRQPAAKKRTYAVAFRPEQDTAFN